MSNQTETEVKRGRGRPASFPELGKEGVQMAGFNLPVSTLETLDKAVETRNAARKEGQPRVNKNTIVDRAIRAYLRDRKS